MKVVFPFSGSSIGGSQLSCVTIYNFLTKKNIYSKFIIHKDGNFKNYLKKNMIKYENLQLKNLPGENPNIIIIFFFIIKNFYKIFNYIKKNNIDIVHGNTLSINLAWSLPTLLAKKKFIWHQRQPLSKSFYWKSIKYLSSYVIANSNFVFETLPSNILNKKRIYNSFVDNKIYNTNQTKNYLLNKYNLKKNHLIIGFVGRVEKSKDVLFTIKVLEKLNNEQKFHFFIIGQQNKSYLKEINTFIKKSHIKKNITFINFEKNINKFISGIDILISSSRNEAFGRILIEAMLQKTLLICSNQGAHPELINDGFNGLLFNKSDPNELTNILNNLFELNNINQKIINNAYNYAYNNFYNDNGLLEIIDIYNMDI